MINAEEHKKLLAQVTELEKNSVNYFDVEKEFFLIDSDNLAEVQTRLYGYSIQATGIYEQDNLTEDAVKNLDGRGCYVYVEVKDGQITIKQDLNGCWGIYLFRHGDYFALSNSFFRLLDHVKFKYPLTVNRDYVNFLMVEALAVQVYSETAVNEISLIERNAVLHIDITNKTFEQERLDFKEYSVPLNSEGGIATLDRWIDFWGGVLRGIIQHTNRISVDLSGGFDSRVAFIVALHSGIDLNKIQINSWQGSHYTYPKDYIIASKIAEHYGFELNQPLPDCQSLNYSLTDVLNMDLYYRQTFHKWPAIYKTKKSIDKTYTLNGYEGEAIRSRFHVPPREFIESQRRLTRPYSSSLSDELFHSVENIFEAVFLAVRNKYKIEDATSADIPHCAYHETWSRSHFGKMSLEAYFVNKICLSPIIDPKLRTLKISTEECSDPNLLIAVFFTRYAPDILAFPFNSGSTADSLIAPETIEYAQKINARFPRSLVTNNAKWGGDYLTCNRATLELSRFSNRGIIIRSEQICYKICSRTYSIQAELTVCLQGILVPSFMTMRHAFMIKNIMAI